MVRQGRRSSRAESGVSAPRLVALLQHAEDGAPANEYLANTGDPPFAGTVTGRTRWGLAGGAVLVVLAVVIGGSAVLLLQAGANQQKAQDVSGVASPGVAVPAVTGSPSQASQRRTGA
ncbi:MAG: hypothetical protein M3017_10350, partial [Actinomycetota bacterium]|nr:hypothetical protein [Actinomycetota bacterium]